MGVSTQLLPLISTLARLIGFRHNSGHKNTRKSPISVVNFGFATRANMLFVQIGFSAVIIVFVDSNCYAIQTF